MSINRTLSLLGKYEGRDKVCKTLMYASNLIGHYYQNEEIEMGTRLLNLSEHLGQARRLFRLFKSIVEIHAIKDLVKSNMKDEFDRLLNIIQRLCYLIYWIFDNLSILGKIKILKLDQEKYLQSGLNFRFFAHCIRLLLYLRNLLRTHYKEITVRKQLPFLQDENENLKVMDQIKRCQEEKNILLIWIAKSIGDILVSVSCTKFVQRFISKEVPLHYVNLGGFISGLISSRQLYK